MQVKALFPLLREFRILKIPKVKSLGEVVMKMEAIFSFNEVRGEFPQL